MTNDYSSVPECLAQRPQWCLFKTWADGAKVRKMPIDARTLRAASSNDSGTWTTLSECLHVLEEGTVSGVTDVGYCFTDDDPFVGVDLDGCCDSDGTLNDFALEVVETLASYTERSVSGRGIHVILEITGDTPSGYMHKVESLGLEWYHRERFFIVSGQLYNTDPQLHDVYPRDRELGKLLSLYVPSSKATVAATVPTTSSSLTVDDVLIRFGDDPKIATLMNGDTSAYNGDASSADGALCMKLAFYAEGNASIMDDIFRTSQLMRPKWDRKQGNTTYGMYQINNAINNSTAFYSANGRGRNDDGSGIISVKELGIVTPLEYLAKKRLRPSFHNAYTILTEAQDISGLFRYNSFSHDIELTKRCPWSDFGHDNIEDKDLILLKQYLVAKYKYEPSIATLEEAVIAIAHNQKYHPVKDYLSTLHWDGTPRLSQWLVTIGDCDDNAYTREAGTLMILAAIARIDKPGTKYDYMPILEGDQGIGKSMLVRTLGGQWYGEVSLIDRDKDTIEKMRGKWFIETAEMLCFRQKESEAMKSFVTTQVDEVRLPYRRNKQRFPRQSTFIGTINPSEFGYLNDITGARRFLPIFLNKVNIALLGQIRDQLFAEAIHVYKKGYPLYISNQSTLSLAAKAQGSRNLRDNMEDDVDRWIHNHEITHSGDGITALEVWMGPLGGERRTFDRRAQHRVANIMKNIGYLSKTVKIDGKVQRRYKLLLP